MVSKKNQAKMTEGADARRTSRQCRSGASKTTSEVPMLYVIETLLAMLSLGGSQSSFCQVCVQTIVKRLADPDNSEFEKHLAEHGATLGNLNEQYSDLLKQLEVQMTQGKELEELEKVTHGKSLLDAPIDDLNLQELEILQKSMAELKDELLKQMEKRAGHSNPTPSLSADLAGVINPSVTNPVRGSLSTDVNDYDDGHGH